MARRTKEDALATRHLLLDVAERVFFEKGVARTSLQDIAQAAGTTRGAIYWHFKNKADLIIAMMARITLPMEEAMSSIGQDPAQESLPELELMLCQVMDKIVSDERTRRVFEITMLKVEYVGELLLLQQRLMQICQHSVEQMQRILASAHGAAPDALTMSPLLAAQGLYALVAGLIHTWLQASQGFDLPALARPAIRAYLRGLQAQP